MGKVIITKKDNCILLFLIDTAGRSQLIRAASLNEKEDNLGNIYVGRVSEVVHGIDAAFIAISKCETVFLSFSDCQEPMLRNRAYDGTLKQGDELVVQIKAPALKTKYPAATAKLSLAGQFCVCEKGGHNISCSAKLKKEAAVTLKEAVLKKEIIGRKKYSFILRTNAGSLTDLSPLFEEMRQFIAIFNKLDEIYQYRSLYSCLYSSKPEVVKLLEGIPLSEYEEIVTDEEDLYKLFTDNFENIPVRFYQDDMLPLSKLYSIDTHLKEALGKKVWLKCGGYLVIEPTEAMVVIDVNSGKTDSHRKEKETYYLKINLEAAKEVARQLRIRNYSGMIMVDFINMEDKENNKILLSALDEYLRKDTTKTRLVDMTALGIVEITRKKERKPLSEWLL